MCDGWVVIVLNFNVNISYLFLYWIFFFPFFLPKLPSIFFLYFFQYYVVNSVRRIFINLVLLLEGFSISHAAPPLANFIQSGENHIWPNGKDTVKGQSIVPLYPGVIDACRIDSWLHEVIALVDAIRVGRVREKEIAVNELKNRILNAKQDN